MLQLATISNTKQFPFSLTFGLDLSPFISKSHSMVCPHFLRKASAFPLATCATLHSKLSCSCSPINSSKRCEFRKRWKFCFGHAASTKVQKCQAEHHERKVSSRLGGNICRNNDDTSLKNKHMLIKHIDFSTAKLGSKITFFLKKASPHIFFSIPEESIILGAKTFTNINQQMLFDTRSV